MKVFVLFVFLLHVAQHASGMVVYEGEKSVLLPCQLPAPSKEGVGVWRRDDLNPAIIHILTEEGDDLADQNKHYINRTSIQKDALQTGDLSLTLRNPTFSDSGTYTCTTRKHGVKLNQTEVQLQVKEHPSVWPTVLQAILVPLVLLAVGFAVFMGLVYTRMKKTAVYQLKVVDVTEGANSVLLPFVSKKLKSLDIVRVEWKRIQDDEMKVVFEKERTSNAFKCDGAEMKKDPWTTGNASLTLIKPCCKDGGVYICTIYGKDGKTMKQKVVALWVKEGWLKTIRGFCPSASQFNGVI